MPYDMPTDDAILAAFPAASRAAFGYEGAGVDADGIALVLAPEPGTYNVANEPVTRHVARRLPVLVRRRLVTRGSYHGRSFYRLTTREGVAQ